MSEPNSGNLVCRAGHRVRIVYQDGSAYPIHDIGGDPCYHNDPPDVPLSDDGGSEDEEYTTHFWRRMSEEERDETLISMAMCGGGLNSDVGEDIERKLRKRLALLRSLRSSLATVSKDKERLDWLDAILDDTVDTRCIAGRNPHRYVTVYAESGASIRDAIDAYARAIDAARSPSSPIPIEPINAE